jgi:hypothetical protein
MHIEIASCSSRTHKNTFGATIIINDGSIDIDSTRLINIMLDTLTSDESIASKNDDIAYQLSVSDDTCQAGGISPDVTTDDNSQDDKDSYSNNDLLNSSWKWQLAMLIMASFSCLILLLLAYSHWGYSKAKAYPTLYALYQWLFFSNNQQ